jgi:hypothetical protein
MRIHGLTVSVNYAEELSKTLPNWVPGLSSLAIVTDLNDCKTPLVASGFANVNLHRTNVFYESGAVFGKSQAMEEARQRMPWEEWILFFDADILPPIDWHQKVMSAAVRVGFLYGVRRRECRDVADTDKPDLPYPHHDMAGLGYFQLFHSTDPAVQDSPLLKPFRNASGYDCEFRRRWSSEKIKQLPFEVIHLGCNRRNWCGKGNDKAMTEMWAERRRQGGWEHEKMK